MATFYWVGGSGIWDNSSISNWSDSSGGLPGASVPGAADTVVFNGASDAGSAFTVTMNANITVQGVTITGLDRAMTLAFGGSSITVNGNMMAVWDVQDVTNFSFTGTGLVVASYTGVSGTREITHGTTGGTEAKAINLTVNDGTDFVRVAGHFGTFNFSGFKGQVRNSTRTIYRNFTLDILTSFESGDLVTTFAGTSDQTLAPAGVNMGCPIVLDSNSTKTLSSSLVLAQKTLSLVRGTFDSAGYTVVCAKMLSSNGNVRGLYLGTSEWDLSGEETVWDVTNTTGLTLAATDSTINLDPMRANQVFAGGSRQYGKLSLASQRMLAEVVAVAGGGGGSGTNRYSAGGGGGAGGYFEGSVFLPLQKAINVRVGGGGAGGNAGGGAGGNGSNSVLGVIALIGGGGGGHAFTGANGGSGGGSLISTEFGFGTPGQGNNGGTGNDGSVAGGGGGASGPGQSFPNRPTGGSGRVSSITGQLIGRGGGGGGGWYSGTPGFATDGGGGGGVGGGGGGSVNTGGGGGGGSGIAGVSTNYAGGSGGSGVIILRIPASYNIAYSAGVTRIENKTTAPGYKIITITATSTINETITIS